jgi:hypothetical protein
VNPGQGRQLRAHAVRQSTVNPVTLNSSLRGTRHQGDNGAFESR